MVTAAVAGASRIAVLVGGSSTGKTRACWQALELLRGREPGWQLWHPIDPQGALAGLPGVGPRTVVWLNEAQRYLDTADGMGERVAARLRELLRDRAQGPVLVLATLWPQFWDELTARPPKRADPHAQARELLTGRNIPVPAAFTGEQLRQLQVAGDPRLAQAAAGSREGQVIQYLAGAPELLDRYHHAPPAPRALIDAAMDAARLGMRPAVPRAFLQAAAPGYLTDTEWSLLPGNWLEEGLDYTKKPAKGIAGPLTPIRPRPSPSAPATPGDGPTWQLADYLDQHGRRTRSEVIPPKGFWAAAATCADRSDLITVAEAAADRGLYRDAARLYKQASAPGDARAGARLVRLLHALHPADQRPADWAVAQASLNDPAAVTELLGALRDAGVTAQVNALADRAAAATSLDDLAAMFSLLDAMRMAGATSQATRLADRAAAGTSLDSPDAVSSLLAHLFRTGATGPVTTLLDRDPAAHVSLDSARDVGMLLLDLSMVRATSQVTTLASRAVANLSLDHPYVVAELLLRLRQVRATGQITTLLDRDPAAHVSLDEPWAVASLLDELRLVGATGQVTTGQVTTLLDRDPAAHASLDEPHGVTWLLNALREAGGTGQIATLADRAAAGTSPDSPDGVAGLVRALREAGATSQITTLASRAAAQISLDDPAALARLLDELREAGATGQVTTLADRAAVGTSLDSPDGVARLLNELREAGATGQVTKLLDRDPAAHASLNDPGSVASLLDALREVGATGQVTTLLDRDPAAHASLNDMHGVIRLEDALREVGATGQVTALLDALREAGATGQATTLRDRNVAPHPTIHDRIWAAALVNELRKSGTQAQAAELIEGLPAAGLFQLFRELDSHAEQFRFGREADGSPAKPWAWTDIG
jgi:hypothetical protein